MHSLVSGPYLFYKSIKDTPVYSHLDFYCLKLKYKVLNLGVWISGPYLYCNSIKDNPVCRHLDFNYLKLKYEVNHDILLFILAPGYTVSTWRCVVLTVYDRHRCQTIARYTGKFSSHLKVKLEFTLVLVNPELTPVLLIPFLKTLDPDQLVSFRGHLIRIYTVSTLIENTDLSCTG